MAAVNNTESSHMLSGYYLTKTNPVFCCYLFWTSILVLKMIFMSILTAIKRMRTKTFANPEDLRMAKAPEVRFDDPSVERVRRAHRNDLENVLPFLLMSLAYVATGPGALVARLLIRIGAICRLLHTFVYAFRPMPQPLRAICFFMTLGITVFEAIYVLCCCIKYI